MARLVGFSTLFHLSPYFQYYYFQINDFFSCYHSSVASNCVEAVAEFDKVCEIPKVTVKDPNSLKNVSVGLKRKRQ